MTIQNLFLILGGLGLFLYGMKLMSDGLENIAGDRMRLILEKATSNRLLAALIGALVTCIIQSSSATTVMVVGFVNASLMTLSQAIGIIMGANIGTTITAQIVSFKIDAVAPLFIFIGLILYAFFKKRNIKNIGYILLGFGILFFGISTMGEPLKDFAKNAEFQTLLTTFQNPLLALLAGIIFTALIQSSSAATGIIVALYLGGVSLPFKTAAYIILGTNIGTCITAVLASIPASRESKRAALVHVLFNIIGSVVFGIIIYIFPSILLWIQNTWAEEARQVAMFHTIFNASTLILLIGFVKQLEKLVNIMIPLLPNENINTKKLIYLNQSIMQTPTIAVTQAHREVCRMAQMANDNLKLSLDAFYTRNSKKAEAVIEIEDTINYLNHQITSWLVRIRGLELSELDLEKSGMMLRTVSDIERIGDHAENIAEYAMIEEKHGTKFSEAAIKELHEISNSVIKILNLTLVVYEKYDKNRLSQIYQLEQKVDEQSQKYVENHIDRLKKEICDPRGGVIFTDMIADLECCSDCATNISYSILGEKAWDERLRKIVEVKKSISKKK